MGEGRRWDLLGSPIFVLSIGVLLVNDHVLKAVWPGWLTGKLSDVAGVAMVAIALTAATGHRSIAFAMTVVAFTALKTVPAVAVGAAPVLGGMTRTDPTDLLAFVVLVPLWRVVGRRLAVVSTQRSRLVIRTAAVAAAVVATTATGCDTEGVERFVTDDAGRIFAVGAGAVSDDGGITWAELADGFQPREGDAPLRSCLADGSCFELRPSFGGAAVVEIGDDGRTQEVLALPGTVATALQGYEQPTCAAPLFGGLAATDRSNGRHLVVAMGGLGAIHIGPDDTAEWVAVRGYGIQANDASDEPLGLRVREPVGTRGFGFALPFGVIALLISGTPLALIIAIWPLTRLARARGRRIDAIVWILVSAGLVVGIVAVFALFALLFDGATRRMTAFALLFGSVAPVVLVPMWRWCRRSGSRLPATTGSFAPPDGADRLG